MTTNYADDLIFNLLPESMDDELQQLAEDDNKLLESVGVSNNRERNLLFYLENFVDDLLFEFGYSDLNSDIEQLIVENSFNVLKNKENVDLFDIRLVVFKQINKMKLNKKAYPNIIGTNYNNMTSKWDVKKWVKTLKEIYSEMQRGHGRQEIEEKLTEGWNPMERNEFKSWSKYYEEGCHEKYNIKTASPVLIPSFSNNIEEIKDEKPKVEEKKAPAQINKVKTPDDTKRSLVSRLDSASRLLREFASVWPPDVWNRLSQSLSDLKREIIPLRSSATVTDCIFKTANIWDRNGFKEGAELLKKIADGQDVAQEIEKALTGKEYQKTNKSEKTDESKVSKDVPEIPELEMPEMEIPEMESSETDLMNLEKAPKQKEDLKQKEELTLKEEPNLKEDSEKNIDLQKEIEVAEENPFDNQDIEVSDVLEILEPILQQLSEREFVRALSKADMMLDSMNIASHFPELGEAMSKSLEMNIYISTRIEKIINKLKGGLREEGEKDTKNKSETPEIEMDELMSSPIEQEMLEIKE